MTRITTAFVAAFLSSLTFARSPLPANPCDLLTIRQVAEATGVEITSATRRVSVAEIVQAEKEHRAQRPGTICVYATPSAYTSITIAIPVSEQRTAAAYRAGRDEYMKTYPGSGQAIPGLGADAWLAGGADLTVLVADGDLFVVGTQMYQKSSRDLLTRLARAILDRR